MDGSTRVDVVPGGVRIVLEVPDPPPVPAGYRLVGWEVWAADTAGPFRGTLLDACRLLAEGATTEGPAVVAFVVSDADPGDWLGTTFHPDYLRNPGDAGWAPWRPTEPCPALLTDRPKDRRNRRTPQRPGPTRRGRPFDGRYRL